MKPTFFLSLLAVCSCTTASADDFQRVQYNHPGLAVDLGVGLWAWPLPMDWDGDGDLDLVVSCPDVPFNGVYFFENPGGDARRPVFRAPVRLGDALKNVQFSQVDGKPVLLTPGVEWTVEDGAFVEKRKLAATLPKLGKTRANQWRRVDYDGDGVQDLVVGIGEWTDYGWDDAFDAEGNWTRGPLHGWVFLLRNTGTNEAPEYGPAVKVQAGGKPVDVYGMPSPNFADFDGDGDLDLLCGEFLDGFTYFQNVGSRTRPVFGEGVRLQHEGRPLAMHVQMITPTAVDWDRDGDVDLVVGDEDGRVALVEHTGRVVRGVPVFLPPAYFQQEACDLKFGALVTPVSVDWDGDGDDDLVCGNTSGNIGWFENLDAGNPPKWAAVQLLEADGRVIHLQAGPNGSIQGPCEAKWGYTTLDVADWDHDGDLDLVVNSIWGKVVWFENTGNRGVPRLRAEEPLAVQWTGVPPKPAWNWWKPSVTEMATQWRTTPLVVDWDEDGLLDLVMLDHEGYLSFFRRERKEEVLLLHPGERVFRGGVFDNRQGDKGHGDGALRLNDGTAGRSGRRKLEMIDWDRDGRLDLLVNSVNVNLLRNVKREGLVAHFEDVGPLSSQRLAGHTTSPTTVDWDGDGVRDLLVGAEDGRLYFMEHKVPEVKKVERSGLRIEGRGFEMAVLKEGGKAYSNRDYTWFEVPEALQGAAFTRTAGGVAASIRVTATADATLRLATAASRSQDDLAGWVREEGLEFGYTDGGRTRMAVFTRPIRAGESVRLPQGNWTGSLLVLTDA